MFADADSIFNSFAWTLEELLQSYDRARSGRPILVSSEPNCWIGHHCFAKDLDTYYPNASKQSPCPQFLNSGQYMGRVTELRQMLHWVLFSCRYLDDQRALTEYHKDHPDVVALDVSSTVFRSLMLGFVNPESSRVGEETCGTEKIRSCGRFETPVSGSLDNTSGIIVMDPVPGDCQESPTPFSIHFNSGMTKPSYWRIAESVTNFSASLSLNSYS